MNQEFLNLKQKLTETLPLMGQAYCEKVIYRSRVRKRYTHFNNIHEDANDGRSIFPLAEDAKKTTRKHKVS